MRLLLDTHIFLWFISGDSRLPESMRNAIEDEVNEVYLSSVSVWEAIVKYQIGKLPLPQPPEIYLPLQRENHAITSLPLNESSIVHLPKIPMLHRDPFDRMLICQAIEDGLAIVTVDVVIQNYPVKVFK